jgi:DNA-binding transcriptional regulator YiaG
MVKTSALVRLLDVHKSAGKAELPAMERLEDQVKKALAKRLKLARKEAGFRFANEFSRVLNIEEHTYRSWERGTHMPDVYTLTRICKLLNVEPNDLLPLALKKRSASENSGNESKAA